MKRNLSDLIYATIYIKQHQIREFIPKSLVITMVAKKVTKKPKELVATKKRRSPETYKNYISKVLKQVHPQTRISKKGVAIVNSFVCDTFERVAVEASKLCRMSKRVTMGSREVQSAIRLVLPGELAKHAVSEGTKAMTKYSQA